MARYICLVVLLPLVGCLPLPIPTTYYDLPHTTGAVSADGAPVSGARVWQVERLPYRPADSLQSASPCVTPPPDSVAVAVTDMTGAFALPAVVERRGWAFIPLVPVNIAWAFGVCYQEGGGAPLAWEFSDMGFTPDEVELSCEVGGEAEFACRVLSPRYWEEPVEEAVPGR